MFDDKIIEIERRALILFLCQVSSNLKLTRKDYPKEQYSKYSITSDDQSLNINFDFKNHQENTSSSLKHIVQFVFNEFNFIIGNIDTELEILDQIALFHNGIINQLKEEQINQPTISFESDQTFKEYIISRKSEIENTSIQIQDYSFEEKDTLMLCDYLLEHLRLNTIFQNGSELLDFLEGTLIIESCLHNLKIHYQIASVFEMFENYFEKD